MRIRKVVRITESVRETDNLPNCLLVQRHRALTVLLKSPVIETHEHTGEFKGECVHVCARKRGAKSNNGVTSDAGPATLFKSRRVQFLETYNAVNWRKFVLLGCVVACVFAASTATAQMRGHGNSVSRMGMRGAFTPRSIAPMPMHRAPMMNSALGLRRINRFNDRDFDRDHRFRRFDHFKEIIFIGVFVCPWS